VRDTKSKDLIVKMVNLLPVAVRSTVDLAGMPLGSTAAQKTVLTGRPADKDARPVTAAITVADKFDTELPPYSFTVIRIKSKP
jgi:alpha-L-arabinofuranosidase